MIKEIIKSIIKGAGYELKRYNAADNQIHKAISYSQCGEDLIVDYIFRLRNIDNPSYIDIGANHPYDLSNTALFYKRGCTGINIDADPGLMNEFKLCRPNDINLNVGISDCDGEMDFYVMADRTLSTFSEQEKNNMTDNGKILSYTVKVDVTTVNTVITQYSNGIFPDFLSLDVEGLDLLILQSINFQKSAPKIICVEAAEYSPIGAGKRRSDLIDFLEAKGYYEYANTNLNAIMVKKEFWFI